MFHHFPDEKNQDGTDFGENYLVRSVELNYAPSSINDSGQTEVNYLVSIVTSGYVRKRDGSYSKKSLPTMTLDYHHLEWDWEVKQVNRKELKNLPEGLSGNYQWTDLYGEGINGILTEQGNAWYYKSNFGDTDDNGNIEFGSSTPVSPKPSFTNLGSSIFITDLDSDGLKELVTRNGGVQGFFSMGTEGSWKTFSSFEQVVNLNMNDPNLRVFDITGDGKPDLVITEERVITYYESQGKTRPQGACSFTQSLRRRARSFAGLRR